MGQVFDEIRTEKALQIARNLIAMGKSTLEDIAAATELPLEKVQELAGIKGTSPS